MVTQVTMVRYGGMDMLTKITLNNFKSFKNKVTVDLMKTNYTILPQNVAITEF